jgi:hypothetical protein
VVARAVEHVIVRRPSLTRRMISATGTRSASAAARASSNSGCSVGTSPVKENRLDAHDLALEDHLDAVAGQCPARDIVHAHREGR